MGIEQLPPHPRLGQLWIIDQGGGCKWVAPSSTQGRAPCVCGAGLVCAGSRERQPPEGIAWPTQARLSSVDSRGRPRARSTFLGLVGGGSEALLPGPD